jgi:hypothetical protein
VSEPTSSAPSTTPRPDAFVSYSRRDAAFVEQRLLPQLQRRDKTVWVDLAEIPPASDWREQVHGAIASAKAFVFVVSPDSVTSPICLQELARAVELHKRLIPVVCRDPAPAALPVSLERTNWIFLRPRDPPERGIDQIVEALETDLEWRDTQARLGVRAAEWEASGGDRSFLVRGSDLRAAERWLAGRADPRQSASPLHTRYVLASRRAATRRQRLMFAAVSAVLVVSLGLTAFALTQRATSRERERTARSGELAAAADLQLATDPELSALLAREAARMKPTVQAENVLRTALSQTHILATVTTAGGPIRSLDVSTSGRYLLTAGADAVVRVWDVRTRALVAELHGPVRGLPGLDDGVRAWFGPDDDHLLSTRDDGTAQMWNWRTRTVEHRLTGLGINGVLAVHRGRTGRLLLDASDTSGPDAVAELWDWRGHRRLRSFGRNLSEQDRADMPFAAAFSADGAEVALIGAETTNVWRTSNGRHLSRTPTIPGLLPATMLAARPHR